MQARKKTVEKKSKILDTALSLVTKNGLHGISMKMIANEANIAAGTIYVHFTNKEEMLASVYEMITLQINQLVKEHYDENSPFKKNFLNIWNAILKAYLADRRIPDFITQYAFVEGASSGISDMLEPVYQLLEEARRDQVVKDIPIAGLIALTHGPITGLVRMIGVTKGLLKEIDVDMYAQSCWDAISNKED
ncbi:MAG: TetR/AcrR family transcriptional regulator [Carboxylicivirga sp.]|jgi:AcrR family transcriptional regulator|nr:TetR/AcrR family transcriptional regulator [Carboxylicivirga sp.]